MGVSGAGARRKGSNGELEVARIAADYGLTLKRTPNSGGLHIKGDLTGEAGLHPEIKRTERLNVKAAYRQARRDAKPGDVPVAIFRQSCDGEDLRYPPAERWLTALTLHDFFSLWRDAQRYRQQANQLTLSPVETDRSF